MDECPGLVTRRDVLKRGAVVGGTVLWVAPLVQTLGMGRAFAADTSGDPCTLDLSITGCTKVVKFHTTKYRFDLEACTPSECACGSTSRDHKILLYIGDRIRGWMYPGSLDPNTGLVCHSGRLYVTGPVDNVQARCVGLGDHGFPDVNNVIGESNLLRITADHIARCTPDPPRTDSSH